MTAHRWPRSGLVFLAVAQGVAGAVQLLLPAVFYERFPIPSHPWVAMLPPYNEHLMRDVEALTLATVLMLGAAAASMDQLLVRTALAADLVFAMPHFVFYTTHLGHFPPVDAIAQILVLAFAVLVPRPYSYSPGGCPGARHRPRPGSATRARRRREFAHDDSRRGRGTQFWARSAWARW